jgi:phospholipase/carboxylesterase
VRDCLERAAEAAGEGIAGLRKAAEAPQPMFAAYQALRAYARAVEALYPMAAHLRPISQFFLEPAMRDDLVLAERWPPSIQHVTRSA